MTEYKEGQQAYRAGFTHWDNPYELNCDAWLQWNNGWWGGTEC